jgi:hypothetical protein
MFVRFIVFGCNPILSPDLREAKTMRYETHQFNRDSAQMYDYLEARIQAMKRRIEELEIENAKLRCWQLSSSSIALD